MTVRHSWRFVEKLSLADPVKFLLQTNQIQIEQPYTQEFLHRILTTQLGPCNQSQSRAVSRSWANVMVRSKRGQGLPASQILRLIGRLLLFATQKIAVIGISFDQTSRVRVAPSGVVLKLHSSRAT